MSLQINTVDDHGTNVVSVEGDVDLYTSPELRTALFNAVAKAREGVGVNLSGVGYMDSSGVATLIEGLRAASKRNAGFALVAPSPPVLKVLQLARLETVFEIQEAP